MIQKGKKSRKEWKKQARKFLGEFLTTKGQGGGILNCRLPIADCRLIAAEQRRRRGLTAKLASQARLEMDAHNCKAASRREVAKHAKEDGAEHGLEVLKRRDLIKDGYMMVQFSEYARPCGSADRVDTQVRRLRPKIPAKGEVRGLIISDAQWGRMIVVRSQQRTESEKIPEQMMFL